MADELTTLQAIQSHGDLNPVQSSRLKELQAAGSMGNPTGEESHGLTFDNGAGGMGMGGGQPALNLPGLYDSLSKEAGISDIEKSITDKKNSFNDAQSKINDNPYLSESNRVGRVQKLQTDYDNDIKTVQDSLAMKKQDIQTKLDLQTKQFDINSQRAQAARDHFNLLLSSGALAGASGSDIAAITAQTGISSSEVQAAIKAQADKNISTSVQTVDDGSNVYSVVLNNKTGEIISKNVLAASKPTRTGSGASSLTQLKDQMQLDQLQAPSAAYQAARSGKTLPDLISFYSQYGMTPQQVYDIYNSVNYYKATPAQQKADMKRYNVK